MREKDRVIRIIIDTLRQERLLTSVKPIVDEKDLFEKKAYLESISYEQVLDYEEMVKNSKLYFYDIASKREDEKDLFIKRIIDICKVEDTFDDVIEESGVYEKLREKLENYSYEQVKGLLEIYRRRKTVAFDMVMSDNNYSNIGKRLKLV